MKLFLSVIGSGKYTPCRFVDGEHTHTLPVRFVQEALLPSLTRDWKPSDRVVTVMAGRPDDVSYPAKEDAGTSLSGSGEGEGAAAWLVDWAAMPPIPQDDYVQRIEALGLPCQHQLITDLPDGLQAEELWQLFERIYEVIHEGDELWLDVTYGVRYFPMLMLVLDHYAKFLKHVHVRRITYANYQAMIVGAERLVPIQDLTTFSVLQDWTIASALFLDTGRTDRLSQLTKEVLEPMLNNPSSRTSTAKHLNRFIRNLERVTDEWRMGRGSDIIEANMLAVLQKDAARVNGNLLPPFMPLFDKIGEVLQPFSITEDVANGFKAAEWCYAHQLYQQCITLLQESIITLICVENGIDWHCSEDRELVGSAFHVVILRLEDKEHRWQYARSSDPQEEERSICMLRSLVRHPLVRALASDYRNCSNVRNDLNHAGMRVNPMTTDEIKSAVRRCLRSITQKIPLSH